MSQTITPRTLKGFRDLEPAQVLQRNAIVRKAQERLETFGFQPIATPVLEYAEILLGKGGGETDKQVYRFSDGGDRDVAMRYDLTVPLARYCAQRSGQLAQPFRAYQIGLVWRGEKAQRGRYREFMQCDFDVLGSTSELSDAEILTVAATLVGAFFPAGFQVRASDRRLLAAFIDECGGAANAPGILRALDKLPKQGRDKTLTELREDQGVDDAVAERLLAFAGVSGDVAHARSELRQLSQRADVFERLERLERTLDYAAAAGVPADRLVVDLSITRGLDYYTGLVFETFALEQENVGSICSGGRYDNLTALYAKNALPGVGGSVGVDRLLSLVPAEPQAAASVLVAHLEAPQAAVRLGSALRAADVAAEVFLESSKLKAQLKYADRQGIPLVAILGGDELASGQCQLKRLRDGESRNVALEAVPAACRELLS